MSNSPIIDLSQWEEIVASLFGDARMSALRHGPFEGRIHTFERSGLSISQLSASAHQVERTPQHAGRAEDRRFILCLQGSGTSLVTQGGRSALMMPGDATIYDTAHPYTLVHEEPYSALGIVIPAQALTYRPDSLEPLLALRMEGSDPVTALVHSVNRAFEHNYAATPSIVHGHMIRSTIDIFEMLCAHHGARIGIWSGAPRRDGFDEISRYIDRHLNEPDLSVESIAAACFMSVRTLQNLARENSVRIAALIRHRRLHRCKADLTNPALAGLTVSAIGSRWGLMSPSHFSTLFHAEFGINPSEYRRAVMDTSHAAGTAGP